MAFRWMGMRMGQGGDGERNGGERLRDAGFSVAMGWGWQRQVGMALGLGMGLGMAGGALGIEVSVVAVVGNSARDGKRLGFGHEVQGCFPGLGSYVRSGFHQVTRRTPS